MDAQSYLLIANAAVWIGIGCYVFFLGRQSSHLKRRMDQLQLLEGSHDEQF
ncbi:MAG: CcmD family protein [Desulfovibrio sp.]|uniref:CcmD family protein n=1 Tax=Desulfovibrio sp. 7SRBS1 TaxID=3378064 RepID=UPI003B3CB020